MARGFLLDTNHLGLAVRQQSPIRARMREAGRNGDRFGTIAPVLCELEVGIQQVSKPLAYRKALARLLAELKIWPLNRQIALRYGLLFHDLKRQG